MSFKDLQLKRGYRSTKDDILNDFYIPVLTEAVSYDRIAGYFSSASLSVAARGIAGLIRNNGRMRLITSPELTDKDYELFNAYFDENNPSSEQVFLRHLEDLENLLYQDHLRALCWLLEQDKLEIKIAIPTTDNEIDVSGLFHLKTGILRDKEGDTLTFSGSVNETASAWSLNREEFKVFLSSDTESAEFSRIDKDNFDSLWSGMDDDVRVIDLPDSVRNELIRRSPKNIEEVLDRIGGGSKTMPEKTKTPYERLGLFDNQEEAVQAWFANDRSGIFEMATGTGKTRTAIGCMIQCFEQNIVNLVVISAPQNTILTQWEKEIKQTGLGSYECITCDSSNPAWHLDVYDNLLALYGNRNSRLIIFTTHRTLSSEAFIKINEETKNSSHKLLICDEVHGIGAKESRAALLSDYELRLGLSATPSRWFDEYGTKTIMDFFGKIVYSFPISEALTTLNPITNKPYLVHYYYYPIFVTLNMEEIEEYLNLTKKIVRGFNTSHSLDEKSDWLEMLMYKRADIYKKAIDKLAKFKRLVNEIDTSNTIVFTCDKHIEHVLAILSEAKIRCHPFTENEGTRPLPKYGGLSQRDYIIKGFVEQDYSALVAIKCLDEGVDIPCANTAIIMTSSGNPREYIQRIGRVIRPNKGKYSARIYDFIVKPSFDLFDEELQSVERIVFEKEMTRVSEISKNAINSMDVYTIIYKEIETL